MTPADNKGTIWLVSLGCPKNLVDSEIMLGILAKEGYTITDREEEADVIIVNTCAFIREAKEESIKTILTLARHKEEGTCRLLVVTGCLPQRYSSELPAVMPEVDHFLGPGEINRIAEVIGGSKSIEGSAVKEGNGNDINLQRLHTGYPFVGWVKIAEGCSNRCSYCVIPSIRGPLKSRHIKPIVEEVKAMVERGVVEVNLIAQDVCAFGLDRREGGELPELLRSLGRINGLKWIRLLYCHPLHMTDEIIRTIADEPAVCKYIDIPVQHIDDEILERMNRRIRGGQIRFLLERIRKMIPRVHIRTTVMVGFPGETDDKFMRLLEFIRDEEFERLGCFKFSREEGTPSFSMDGQVPERIKRERLRAVMELQASISRKKNCELVGTVQDVLVECPSRISDFLKGSYRKPFRRYNTVVVKGRNQYQAPEIDGNVYITGANSRPGEIVAVRIKEAYDYDLIGEILLDGGQDRSDRNDPPRP